MKGNGTAIDITENEAALLSWTRNNSAIK